MGLHPVGALTQVAAIMEHVLLREAAAVLQSQCPLSLRTPPERDPGVTRVFPSLCLPMGGVMLSARRLFRHTASQGIPMLLTCSTIGCPSRTVLLYGPLRSHVLPDLSCIRLLARRSVLIRYPFLKNWCCPTSSWRCSIS